MITFYQYLQQFHEIITLDNPEIEKQMEPFGYQGAPFKGFKMDIENTRFSCYLKYNELDNHIDLGHGNSSNNLTVDYLAAGFSPIYYEIYFSGINYDRTNLGTMDLKNIFGAKANFIYNFMIIAIKKTVEEYENEGKPVNIIKYFGIDPATDAMYQRFFEQYLKNDYIRVSKYFIMKKEIFNQLAEKNDKLINNQLEAEKAFQDHLKSVEIIRKQRRKERAQLAKAQQP